MNNDQKEYYPVAMTIAGSDSGGGAGIQADLRTFSAFGVYGCSAITSITAQNPREVRRIDPLPPESVTAQIKTVSDRIRIGAAKTGMLFDADIISAVADCLSGSNIPLVVDPVMVATSGAVLLAESAIDVLKERLLPLAAWITPNIPEAEILTGIKIENVDDMIKAASICAEKWNCNCIIKSGHLEAQDGMSTDIAAVNDKLFYLSSPLADARNAAHGTGCTLSSALTATIALGVQWKRGLRMAKGFVFGSLEETVPIGPGIEAMYPPSESYFSKISLTRID